MLVMQKAIEDHAADFTFKGEQFSMYFDAYESSLEAFYPKRACIENPEKMIDAALRVYVHPSWPDLEWPISRKAAEEIILGVSLADAIHETIESLRPRLKDPHPPDEDRMWDFLIDVGAEAARKIMKGYPE